MRPERFVTYCFIYAGVVLLAQLGVGVSVPVAGLEAKNVICLAALFHADFDSVDQTDSIDCSPITEDVSISKVARIGGFL